MKKQIGVIFGSRSCEREVAIISAVQLMRHADRGKYDIIPVYIDENGNWYTGEKLTDISSHILQHLHRLQRPPSMCLLS